MRLKEIAILTNIKGLGSANMLKIINYAKANSLTTLQGLVESDLTKVVSKKLANAIYSYLDTDIKNLYTNIELTLQHYREDGIECIAISDERYPRVLKESTNPPVILYCKGNINLLSSLCVATIGTRENTLVGEKIATKTVEFLVENNFTIVSGLAKGVDEITHKTALNQNGKTIAVLPLIDNIYPVSNQRLAQDIVENGGLLIAEVKPNTHFHSSQLVKRDRIQSGLSQALFIFESTIDGGSMHATNDAIKLGRPVFTPDIYKLKSEYQYQKQMEGIKYLIDTKRSIAYSSDSYTSVKKIILKMSFTQGLL